MGTSLLKHTHLLAIVHLRSAEGDDFLPGGEAADHFDRIAKRLADLDDVRRSVRFSVALRQAENREQVRIGGCAHYSAERYYEPWARIARTAESERSDHAGPDVLARVLQSHFNRKDPALRVGLRGD